MASKKLTVLICRNVAEADAGGTLVEIEQADVERAFDHLRSLCPAGAAAIEDPLIHSIPRMPASMPSSIRLLRVWYAGSFVGVVIDTFKNGKLAQQDGIVSQGCTPKDLRKNLDNFFR